MNKLYLRLHNAPPDFKKQFLSIGLLIFLMLHSGIRTNAQCDVNPVTNQVVCNNIATTAINFTGTATTFSWVNNTPSIGLPASGTGNIPSFTALNPSTIAVTATITVTPSNGACIGTPISFTITVNPLPLVIITSNATCGGPCNSMTASGANSYVWSPLAGLYTDCGLTFAYTGTNLATVYTAPTNSNTYAVTGTNTTTGCFKTVFAVPNYTPAAPVVVPPSVNMCLGDPAVKLQVLTPTGTAQFCSGGINIPAPDNDPGGASSSIVVAGIPASCTVTGMTVNFYMPHTKAGNMVFVLKAPDGQILNLDYYLSATGGSGVTTGFVNTVISSTGTVALSAGTNPYTGTFKADGQATPAGGFGPAGPNGMLPTTTNWNSLMTGPVNGNWTLGFYDGVTGDVGYLGLWCLNFNLSCPGILAATPAIWSPATGLYMDQTCTVPYPAGYPINSVWTRPVPAGVFPYQVTTQSVPGPPVGFTNPAAISIPVGGAAALYPSNVTVSGLPASGVKVASVVLHGVSHTRSNDIDVVLQSPSGQNVILMSDVGGANAINATYTFIDWAPFMSSTTANPTGTYRPSNAGQPDNFPPPGPGSLVQNPAISMFTGNMNGTWKLFVVDDDGTSDQGMMPGGYTINFDIGIPCTSPPTTVTVNVGQSTTITSQPVNATVCSTGGVAAFSVTAAGAGPFTYQWQVGSNGPWSNITNGGIYSGATTPTLTITNPPAGMNGYYYRVVINGTATCGTTSSMLATLTVNTPPTPFISGYPLVIGPLQTSTIIANSIISTPPNVLAWYYNNAVLPGETSTILHVNYGSPGDYQLRVTDANNCGVGVSNTVTIANSFAFSLNMYTYPNPSGGIFQVRYRSEPNNTLQRSLTVYNNQGVKIITRNFTQTVPYQKIDIDVRAHGKGLFWVEIRDANGKRLAINRVVVQ
jgi:subtilisin-like proprotein convertase family protein